MGMSNYECEICGGGRCARYEDTNPCYAQDDDSPCTERCSGGQSCAERTSVMVPEYLVYAAADAPLPVSLPAYIPSLFDGYHQHPEVPLDGPTSTHQHMTSGMLQVPQSSFVFLGQYNHNCEDGMPMSVVEGERHIQSSDHEADKISDMMGMNGGMGQMNLIMNLMMQGNIAGALALASMDTDTDSKPRKKYVFTYKQYCRSCWEESFRETDPNMPPIPLDANGNNDLDKSFHTIKKSFTYKTMAGEGSAYVPELIEVTNDDTKKRHKKILKKKGIKGKLVKSAGAKSVTPSTDTNPADAAADLASSSNIRLKGEKTTKNRKELSPKAIAESVKHALSKASKGMRLPRKASQGFKNYL